MEESLLIGGDFNRSKAPLPSHRQATAATNELQVQLALSVVWRLIHLNKCEYIFYSSVHNSHSSPSYLF